MAPIELKVSRIGNSRGIRLPAVLLKRYQIGATLFMEELSDGIILRPNRHAVIKLSFEDTARAMAATREDWSEWDASLNDGLGDIAWSAPRKLRVAETRSEYQAPRRKPKR